MIGGIAANNASGMCCGTAQNSYNTLAGMRLVLADGTFSADSLGKAPRSFNVSPGWVAALKRRETWGFALGKFLTDPVWWFYLFWLPKYLVEQRGFTMVEIALCGLNASPRSLRRTGR